MAEAAFTEDRSSWEVLSSDVKSFSLLRHCFVV